MPEPEESIEIGGWTLTPDELRAILVKEDGVNPFLLAEAIASVRLSHDEAAQTFSLDGEADPT